MAFRLLRDRVWTPAREALTAWYEDSAPRWSAAIAFYTIFSLAPVLIIVTAVAGALWGDQAVRAEVLAQFRDLLGERGAQQVDQLIRAALPGGGSVAATAAGIATLLLGATAVFTTLRNALNAVWGVAPGKSPGVWRSAWVHMRTRLLSFAVVLCMAFLLAASLVVSAGLSALGGWMGERLPAPVAVLRLVETAVTFGVLWLLFAVIFRWLPDARIAWKDVWIGAAVTAALFSAGKLAIGLYLGRPGLASAYGVAGSVVLILLWVYYSAMVFLLGAEFTEVYSRRFGSQIRPADGRVPKAHPADGFSAPRDKTREPFMDTGPLHVFRRRTVALLLLAVSPFAALVLFQGMEDRRHAAQQARAESRRLVRLTTAVHRQLLADARQLLFVLGNVPAVQRGEAEACTRLFRDVITRYPQYSSLRLVRPEGHVTMAAYPAGATLDRADQEALEEAAASGGFVEGPLRVTKRHLAALSIAHRMGGGHVVLATIDLQWLTREAATADLPAGSSVTVWDAAGGILLRYPEPERWIGRRRPDSRVFEAIAASGGDGTAEAAGVDGVERLYGFGRLDSRGEGGAAFLAVGVPSVHAFAEARRRQRRNLTVLAAVALAAAAASRFAGNRLLAPLVERLHVLADTDPLTSLANRRAFVTAARREMWRAHRFGRPLALVMLDIDRFKAVNDRHGHVAGDAVLREVSRRLLATARDADLVARYGGEEFVVLLPESGLETALATAERLRGAVAAAPIRVPGNSVPVTVSAGVAVPHGREADLTEWLQAADKALYRAKANGRNRVESAAADAVPSDLGGPRRV